MVERSEQLRLFEETLDALAALVLRGEVVTHLLDRVLVARRVDRFVHDAHAALLDHFCDTVKFVEQHVAAALLTEARISAVRRAADRAKNTLLGLNRHSHHSVIPTSSSPNMAGEPPC